MSWLGLALAALFLALLLPRLLTLRALALLSRRLALLFALTALLALITTLARRRGLVTPSLVRAFVLGSGLLLGLGFLRVAALGLGLI